jgi:hypothetical protein
VEGCAGSRGSRRGRRWALFLTTFTFKCAGTANWCKNCKLKIIYAGEGLSMDVYVVWWLVVVDTQVWWLVIVGTQSAPPDKQPLPACAAPAPCRQAHPLLRLTADVLSHSESDSC